MDVATAVDMNFWGYRTYEGVDFYIEPETVLLDICPFKKPKRGLPCPHSGLSAETFRDYRQLAFYEGKPDPDKIFHPDLKIKEDMTFFHANFLPMKYYLQRYLSCTNAIPLIIYGVNTTHDYQKIFDIARSSKIRPVHIYGSGLIPVPSDFRE